MDKPRKTQTKATRVRGYELTCVDNMAFDELSSSLFKMMRQNREKSACWAAYLLHTSGYYRYVWKRLLIFTSEDIGNANPMAITVIMSLKQSYDFCIDSKNRQSITAYTILFQAVTYLCRSMKTREADSLATLIDTEYNNGKRIEIEDWTKDPHTEYGKQKYGKWDDGTPEERKERYRMWVEVWSKATDELTLLDRYMPKLRQLWELDDE